MVGNSDEKSERQRHVARCHSAFRRSTERGRRHGLATYNVWQTTAATRNGWMAPRKIVVSDLEGGALRMTWHYMGKSATWDADGNSRRGVRTLETVVAV